MKLNSEVLARIRQMILQGSFAPGQRIPEAQVAERLGVSRTPVRQALPVLAREGLLVASGARGFAVRAFTIAEIAEGVDVRGALEGFAARQLAERGASAQILAGCAKSSLKATRSSPRDTSSKPTSSATAR